MQTDTPELTRAHTFLMAGACGASVANIYFNQPLLGDMARSCAVSGHEIGVVPLATQAGYALGLLFLVPLGDLFERRRLILVMTALLAMSLVAVALSGHLAALAVSSLVVGCLATIAQQLVPFAAQMARPQDRGKVVGTVMSGLLLGILLARTVSGFVATWMGWQAVFWMGAALMVVMGAVMARGLPEGRPTVRMSYSKLMRSLWELFRSQPVLREAAIVGGLLFGAFSAFWATLTLYLESPAFGADAQVAGLFGLVGVAGALAAPIAGRLADRGGPRTVVVWAAAVVLLSYLVFGLAGTSMTGLVIGVLLLDIGVQGAQISNQARIYALIPEARSRLNSVYMVGYFIGGAAGSGLGSLAWAQGGWTAVAWVGGSMATLALVYLALGSSRVRVVMQ